MAGKLGEIDFIGGERVIGPDRDPDRFGADEFRPNALGHVARDVRVLSPKPTRFLPRPEVTAPAPAPGWSGRAEGWRARLGWPSMRRRRECGRPMETPRPDTCEPGDPGWRRLRFPPVLVGRGSRDRAGDTHPAGVSARRRPCRSVSATPSSRSSALSCMEIPGAVRCSSSATAAIVPDRSSAESIRSFRTSSIDKSYH